MAARSMIPMTAEQRAAVCARLDELADEIREMAREIASFRPHVMLA
jgi:hypothetical protein